VRRRSRGCRDDAGGAALGEGLLLVVDEAALEGEGDEDAEDGEDDVEPEHLVGGHFLVGDPHVGGHAGDEGAGHVAGGGGDGLAGVVLEDGHVAHAEAREEAEGGEGEDDGGEADAEGPAGLGADVEVGGGEDGAEDEAGERRSGG
jgi:hypothetical protein